MAGALGVSLVAVLVLLTEDIGRATKKPLLRSILSKSPAINTLSAARLFLFGARDIWFVVALPVFLDSELRWSFTGIANAAGRLIGTLLSGVLYLVGRLSAALWGSAVFVLTSWFFARRLPATTARSDSPPHRPLPAPNRHVT